MMIFVWPVGVPLCIIVLLWRSRAPLLEFRRREQLLGGCTYSSEKWASHVSRDVAGGVLLDEKDSMEPVVEGYLWSLTESYRGGVFYFEVVEYTLQKLALVGLLVFFQPGTLEQLTLGLIVCFSYFGICCYLMPFASDTDNLMVCATQFSLFIAMLTAVIIEHGNANVPQSVILILTVAALVPAVLGVILSIIQACEELGCDPLGSISRRAGKGGTVKPRIDWPRPPTTTTNGATQLWSSDTSPPSPEFSEAELQQARTFKALERDETHVGVKLEAGKASSQLSERGGAPSTSAGTSASTSYTTSQSNDSKAGSDDLSAAPGAIDAISVCVSA